MRWDASALAAELSELPAVPAVLAHLPAPAERAMRANGARMWERLLWTTLEFSHLHGAHCSGCSAYHGKTCTKLRGARSSVPSRKVLQQAKAYGFNLSRTPACGRTSYLGEDGSRDALTGLIEVLRLRLSTPPPPPEPWSGPHNASARSFGLHVGLLDAGWYARRKAWYDAALVRKAPLGLLVAVPPAASHLQKHTWRGATVPRPRDGRPAGRAALARQAAGRATVAG